MSNLIATSLDKSIRFDFESSEEFEEKSGEHKASEYKFTCSGTREDEVLFSKLDIDASNLDTWFDEIEPMDNYQKTALYYLIHVVGRSMYHALSKVEEVTLYEGDLKEAASELFDEIYLNEIPENLQFYIDYDLFARDCEVGGDLCEFEFAGTTYTCTNANM